MADRSIASTNTPPREGQAVRSPVLVLEERADEARSGVGKPNGRSLSVARVAELVSDFMARRFYGKLTLHFEGGHIVCAKLEQTIKG